MPIVSDDGVRMNKKQLKQALDAAADAARAAGEIMRKHRRLKKTVAETARYDIKIELDVRCQKTIEAKLAKAFPNVALLGEEGVSGDPAADYRWVVDPIDGTVNFVYEIPHACTCIALQKRISDANPDPWDDDNFETVAGVIYDPFADEMWTAIQGQKAKLNGTTIQVNPHSKLSDTVIATGFAKRKENLDQMLPVLNVLAYRTRKVRIMGSAALSLAYVASGRFDAYIEAGVYLWDIAAGGLIVECAGGEMPRTRIPRTKHRYSFIASNGKLRKPIERIMKQVAK
jgi:myo-inositol-1(or 4)-monophosphatase